MLGHRGASADAPENTLEAFAEAARQGADGVELDAMVCGSGEVVVCHDERLHRLAGLSWEVRKTPLQKLQQADVGSALGFAPARIPTLESVLRQLPEHFWINIELKCDELEDGGLAKKVGALVDALELAERVVISSFNPWSLFRIAASHPHLRRGVLVDPDRSFHLQEGIVAPLLANFAIHPFHEACTAERVARWRARGWNVAVWTVDDPVRARHLRDWGVTECITNRPGELKRGLG